MYYLLFIAYLVLFCAGLNRIGFVKNTGLDKRTVILLFLVKVAAGLCMGWITLTYFGGGDYGSANMYGRLEHKLLLDDPNKFFRELFDAEYSQGYGGMFDSVNSFWHDLAGNCIYKLLAIFNFLSRGNFYINTLFLNFIGFFGHLALFRVFNDVYKDKKWLLLAGCFLIPSTLYFSSGLHKDNLAFTAVCIFSYAIYFLISRSFSFRKVLLLIVSSAVLLLIKNYVLIALIPPAIALYVAGKTGKTWLSFLSVYGLSLLLIFCSIKLSPSRNPLHTITQKQQDFFKLETARTQVNMDTLQPTIGSFASNIPSAIERAYLRPYVWEQPTRYLLIPALEIVIYIIILALAFFLQVRNYSKPPPFVLFGIFFSATIFLFIGFVVPNFGSIVRYRSLYLPFLLIPALAGVLNHIKKYNM